MVFLSKGKSGAGRRQCSEPQMLKIPCGADVPRIRDNETSLLMKRAERLPTDAESGAHVAPVNSTVGRDRSFEFFHRDASGPSSVVVVRRGLHADSHVLLPTV